MKAADLREKNVEDLLELQKTLAHDVFQSRLKNFTNRLDDTSAIRKTKRDLARVTTLLREREIGDKGAEAKASPAPERGKRPDRNEKTAASTPEPAEPGATESIAAKPKRTKRSRKKSETQSP
jgi:large subunit ribosomal protein L29